MIHVRSESWPIGLNLEWNLSPFVSPSFFFSKLFDIEVLVIDVFGLFMMLRGID